MAKKISFKKIEEIVKEYIKLLKADGLDIEKILLYGSCAKGTQKKDMRLYLYYGVPYIEI